MRVYPQGELAGVEFRSNAVIRLAPQWELRGQKEGEGDKCER